MQDQISLRAQIRSELPSEAFTPQPQKGLWLIPLLVLSVSWVLVLTHISLSWYAALIGSLVIGNIYSSFVFLGHEILHGSVVRSRRLQSVLGYLCFLPFCLPSPVWRAWHVQLHHGNTNQEDDPDGFGNLERFQRVPLVRFTVKYLAPGSGHWLSAFFLFYWFTFRSYILIWKDSGCRPGYEKLNRSRAMIANLLETGFWVALAVWGGWKVGVFAVAIPIMIANFMVMHYIITNHFVRSRPTENDPLIDSMSVTKSKFWDLLHLNFSHHMEHHLFPSMNWRFTPLVRRSLMKHVGERYLAPPHWKALQWIYRTPRIYKDGHTLINPHTGQTVAIQDIEKQLVKTVRRSPKTAHEHFVF
jgi:fatty acid desaturase